MTEHVRGDTYAQRSTPRFEYKPTSPGHTGGGYARIRSSERRAHTPGDGTEDVYVSVHRLCAVAWLLPEGTLGETITLDALDGVDVHHTLGMPAANGEDWLELVDHGTHAEVTQSQMRAWAEDSKRDARDRDGGSSSQCGECGKESESLATIEGLDGQFCLACATEKAKATGRTIEV